MNIINSKQLLGQLNWRYATKQFDPNRKISDQDWATIEQALLLTPSSGGLQPWKFIVVTDPAVRAKLLPASSGRKFDHACFERLGTSRDNSAAHQILTRD